MAGPPISGVARLALKAGREVPGTARRLLAEVQGDGVTVTRVHLPADPERAARRICEAIALRTRVAPVRLPV
jgi:hypothetical protein